MDVITRISIMINNSWSYLSCLKQFSQSVTALGPYHRQTC